ncbi:MAG: VWA domain-containing protein [Acidobacteriota bacterium]|nr:VWA domain-containing protein [Acidobacteriota bacterium]
MSFDTLAHPAWLLLWLVLPWLILRHHRRGPAQAQLYSSLPQEARGGWRLHAAFYLRLTALALVVVALARPQAVDRWQEETRLGIDILVALDVSGSMAAEDFQPQNRLAVAKDVVRNFVQRRPGDRIGALIFADTALTRSPLTLDHRALIQALEAVELDSLPDGTAIGVALATAALRLENSQAATRVVVLVTDGANNGGEVDPATAAALCAGLGIRVYTVGVGTDERVPVPRTFTNPRTGQQQVERRYTRLEVDEELLQAIAQRTGGRYFPATDEEGLEQVFAEIDELERSEIVVARHRRTRELFVPWASAALALTLLPLVLAAAGWSHPP